ncbi:MULTISPECIES: VF530 family protein [unclassified Acidovorax]|uniref:VF530 family protein n=1 Tax=unclassified Acidovorax TaxID=2684926 RepID=UPI000A5BA55F|nr:MULTISPECIES: VF530 family protein [unclassified Acidovorax]
MNANEPTPIPGSSVTEGTPAAPGTPAPPSPAGAPAKQPRNPLHGVTLEAMVVGLADYFGWDELGQQIPIRCFQIDPSVGSSLKFLRKTPWAREKVESLYLFMLRDQRRNGQE